MSEHSMLLASRSPRRRLLLQSAGIGFEVVESGVDDSELRPGRIDHRTWTAALAYLKAECARRLLVGLDDRTVLGADTMVLKKGRMLGQPADETEAREMILLLENGAHEVVSGIALVDVRSGRRLIAWDVAVVTVGRIGADRIDQYVSGGGWRGKAGGYNLSERQEAGWPVSCKGDPSTVMGLPIALLRRMMGCFRRESMKT